MSERDELANIAYLSMYPDPKNPRIQPLTERSKSEIDMHYGAADAILAADYRKPRVITIPEELHALPVGSVILDRHGMTWQKHDAGNDPLWHAAKHNTFRYDSAALASRLPAIVLHEGDAK